MQKGFIQIPVPILIAILVGVFAFSGAGYVAVKQYQDNQQEKLIELEQQSIVENAEIEKERLAVENKKRKEKALQDELNILKNEILSLKNQEPQVIIKTIEKNSGFDLPAVVKQWTPRVARITCKYTLSEELFSKLQKLDKNINPEPQYGTGTGFLIEAYDTNLGRTITAVTTNNHVIKGHNGFSFAESCVVKLGSYSYNVNKEEDIRTFSTDSKVEFIDNEWYSFPNIDAASIIIRDPDPEIKKLAQSDARCSTRPSIGEPIVVLGFPSVGSQKSITATEGIISGTEDAYYVTSAKVERGNSGGAAFWVKENCYIGIPTFVLAGDIESFARILDINYVFNQ